MNSKGRITQSGYSLIELMIVLVIVGVVAVTLGGIIKNAVYESKIKSSAEKLTSIPTAVQRRVAHDGTLFSLWDENGGQAPTGATLSWAESDRGDFLRDYFVGRQHPGCGNAVSGWNPTNTTGEIDGGDETLMETTALVGCNELRGQLPWNAEVSSALSEDVRGHIGTFAHYINLDDADFGDRNEVDNNFINYAMLRPAIEDALEDKVNGVPEVVFVDPVVLDDLDDDVIYTATECEDTLAAGDTCYIGVYINYAGRTNGRFKRTNNLDYFVDDITFGRSIAEGRQQCAYWTMDAGAWTAEDADCAIKAGANDDEVVLVFDSAQVSEFLITEKDAAGAITHLCNTYDVDANDKIVETVEQTPCGFTQNGGVIQLLSENAQIENVRAGTIVSGPIYATETTLYSDVNGQTMLAVMDSTNTTVTFAIDNNGNTTVSGTIDVEDVATFADNVFIDEGLFVDKDAEFAMMDSSAVLFGETSGAGASLTFSRDGGGRFEIASTGIGLDILAGENGEGIRIEDGINGEKQIELTANDGVVAANGTTLHGSKSTLTGEDFNAAGIDSEELKRVSELVTADMAKYLDDTSSPIQIVGIDKVEGEFLELTKPNCLAFLDDANYSSPAANPYRRIIDSGALNPGESYARLVLVPMYFKTYNSAFGANQMFAQHAAHSSPTTWSIYLYLSGEGANGTGAREDAAGGSLAVTLCDYNAINFSRQTF